MLYFHQIDGGFNISAVPKDFESFENRKLFPQEWAGISGTKLQEITNVKTATFCHKDRFLVVAEKLEDAIELAKIANRTEE